MDLTDFSDSGDETSSVTSSVVGVDCLGGDSLVCYADDCRELIYFVVVCGLAVEAAAPLYVRHTRSS